MAALAPRENNLKVTWKKTWNSCNKQRQSYRPERRRQRVWVVLNTLRWFLLDIQQPRKLDCNNGGQHLMGRYPSGQLPMSCVVVLKNRLSLSRGVEWCQSVRWSVKKLNNWKSRGLVSGDASVWAWLLCCNVAVR